MRSTDLETRGLSRVVRRFRMRFQIRPAFLSANKGSAEARFDLELYGFHGKPWNHPDHSCTICRNMLVALLAVADRVLPTDRNFGINCESTTRYVAPPAVAEMKVEKTVICRRPLSQASDAWALQIVEHTRDALVELGCGEIRQGSVAVHLRAHIDDGLKAPGPSACTCAS